MGCVPPPRPLTEKEFCARWRPGITLAELDPAFWSWYSEQRRLNCWRLAALAVGALTLLAMVAMVWLS